MNSSIYKLYQITNHVISIDAGSDINTVRANLNWVADKFSGVNSDLEDAYRKAAATAEQLYFKFDAILYEIRDACNKFIAETEKNEYELYNDINIFNTEADKLLKELESIE